MVSVRFSHSGVSLCDPTNCSTPGFPVHNQLPEFAQTQVHPVGDAIQPSHPLYCPLLPLPSIFPSIRVFSKMSQFFASVSQSTGASASASVLPVNIQDCFPLGWTGWISLQSRGLSSVFSNTTSPLSFLQNPNLTSIHDHWKNHSFD